MPQQSPVFTPAFALACLITATTPVIAGGGSFDVIASPNLGSRGNFLNGVAAVAPDDIWAVGLYRVPGVPSVTSDTFPLAIHWDGNAWTVSDLPSLPAPPNGPDAYLNDIAAFGPDEIWAVGGAKPENDLQRPQTLVFRRDASGWQRIPSPVAVPNDGGSYFIDIAGLSPDDLWAVGNVNGQFLAAHWDGSGWDQTPVPPGDFEDQELRALSVIATDNVWAAGGTGEGFAQPYIVQWTGSSWDTPIPQPPMSEFTGLWDVIAFDDDNIWVAANTAGAPPSQVFLHWDGSDWTDYPAPPFHSARYVGTSDDLYSIGYNEVMHWNGAAWAQVAALSPNQPFGGFNDAVMLDNGVIWGVGRTTAGDSAETLTARYQPSCEADLNDDGSLDFFDVSAFLAAFSAQEPDADFDGNGVWDFFDVSAFLGAFSAGCP